MEIVISNSIFVCILFVVIIFVLITHISSFAHLFFINKTKELSLIVNKRKMIGMIAIGFFLSNAKCTITTEKYFRSPEVKVIIWQIRPPNLARFSLYCFSYTNNTMKTFYSCYYSSFNIFCVPMAPTIDIPNVSLYYPESNWNFVCCL